MLSHLRDFSLTPIEDGWPFLRLSSGGPEEVHFLAVEVGRILPDYAVELSDADAEALRLPGTVYAMIFNIVTVHSSEPSYITVNLIGPVVVNCVTQTGRQVIIQSGERYSTMHVLVDERSQAVAA